MKPISLVCPLSSAGYEKCNGFYQRTVCQDCFSLKEFITANTAISQIFLQEGLMTKIKQVVEEKLSEEIAATMTDFIVDVNDLLLGKPRDQEERQKAFEKLDPNKKTLFLGLKKLDESFGATEIDCPLQKMAKSLAKSVVQDIDDTLNPKDLY